MLDQKLLDRHKGIDSFSVRNNPMHPQFFLREEVPATRVVDLCHGTSTVSRVQKHCEPRATGHRRLLPCMFDFQVEEHVENMDGEGWIQGSSSSNNQLDSLIIQLYQTSKVASHYCLPWFFSSNWSDTVWARQCRFQRFARNFGCWEDQRSIILSPE